MFGPALMVFLRAKSNSMSADSGEQAKESTSIFSSVFSGFVMYAIALLTVALIAWIFVYAISYPSSPLLVLYHQQ